MHFSDLEPLFLSIGSDLQDAALKTRIYSLLLIEVILLHVCSFAQFQTNINYSEHVYTLSLKSRQEPWYAKKQRLCRMPVSAFYFVLRLCCGL